MNSTTFVFLVAFAALAGCGGGQWDHKAVGSVKAASALVGGFSNEDRALYARGLQHLVNTHIKPGSLTIGQVIDQERTREERASAARALATQHRLDTEATENLKAALQTMNSSGPRHLFVAGRIEGSECGLRINADAYEGASDQDKTLMKQLFVQACSASYQLLGKDQRRLPADGLHLTVYDLADNHVYTDTIAPAEEPHTPARVHRTLAHADPRGAYKVIDRYEWACSSNGGFGEKVMALTHRHADLDAVYHRWMKENVTDKSQCIHFEGYASSESYDAAQHPSHYSDAQLESIPNGVEYTNNPNSGYEAWTDAAGNEHVLHRGHD